MDTGTSSLFASHPSGYPAAFVAGRTVNLQLFVPASKEDGNPVEPLHRPRAKVLPTKPPRPHVYNDPRSTKWEEYVAQMVMDQLMKTPTTGEGDDFVLPLRDCRILMTVRFNLPKPKSYPARVVHHTKKPDLDNYAKAILDGLVKGRILEDDGLVTDLMIQKRYVEAGHPEGVEIDLTALPCEVV